MLPNYSTLVLQLKLKMLLLILLIHTLIFTTTSSDLTTDRAALLAFRSAVGGRTFLWNISNTTSPCNWAGVQCENNRVTVLRLPASALSGKLPVNTISNLTRLRTLSLRLNNLSGPLPYDLSKCVELRNIYVQGNYFTGPISFLFGLRSLVRLNLAHNNFSGEIPSGFNNLTRLRTLLLERNHFYGSLPELKFTNLEQFNVSFNKLNGSVPRSLESMPMDVFLGNSLCGKPLGICPGGGAQPAIATAGIEIGNSTKKNKLSSGAVAGVVIGSVVGFLVLLLLLFVLFRTKNGKKMRSFEAAIIKQTETEVSVEKQIVESENGGGNNGYSVAAAAALNTGENGAKKLVFFGDYYKAFGLEDLLKASAEVLGKGTFGTAYKAVLEIGTIVAVKRLKDVAISEKEFREKIEIVGAMNHENLVPLRTYYYSGEEKLLVYDYMPMGSLSALLHGSKGAGRTPLNWEIRSSIALGIAQGIDYLHSQGPNISHANIKSSNVLLTKSYEARVSDFGLANLVGPPSSPTRVAGYRAPEVTDPRKVSQKADVYSFGVLLLELLTGKAPTHALLNEEGVDLPRWVESVVREEWPSEVFDIELLRYKTAEEEMVQLLQLAIDCTAQYPDNRPSMSEVSKRIEELRRSTLREHSDLVNATD
ncbi:PREDICTED: probable inactive receptor kinase At1g48480 [Nicotiana attenuata]|uniref:Inactive receptor kinase rlk902 n=1 Tax=Nicotiana attenuata TaxID=49451 RepID=A0A1J6IVK5_NICAT|nr:PREDICTED: probable inactive receptor kinase At1g48480 [Nicotiana attenuata]OIT02827.1 putative inactive receptor kinase rlk902 [Nicotiana attenuata]